MLVAQPLISTDRTAAVLFWTLYSVWIAGELLIVGRSVFRRGAVRDRGSLLVVLLSIFLAFAVAGAATASAPGAAMGAGSTVFAFALAIMAAGVALRFCAVIVLGRYFTPVVMTSSGQRVVDSGPYRWIRHPSYTGALLAICGVVLADANWLALLGVLPALAGFLYRIGVEEQALSEVLGEPYRSYMRRTKRLVPFVY